MTASRLISVSHRTTMASTPQHPVHASVHEAATSRRRNNSRHRDLAPSYSNMRLQIHKLPVQAVCPRPITDVRCTGTLFTSVSYSSRQWPFTVTDTMFTLLWVPLAEGE